MPLQQHIVTSYVLKGETFLVIFGKLPLNPPSQDAFYTQEQVSNLSLGGG